MSRTILQLAAALAATRCPFVDGGIMMGSLGL